MNIFFNGDSWTWGYNLENRELRYASLLSKTYTDISIHGCSNRTILRTTLNHDISKYDLGIINLTHKNRTEFFDEQNKDWQFINMGRYKRFSKETIYAKKMQDYYEYVYSDSYGESDEFIAYTAIKNYFAVNNVPLILTTIQKDSKLSYDLLLNTSDIPRCAKSVHPNIIGHQKIYEKLDSLVKNKIQTMEIT